MDTSKSRNGPPGPSSSSMVLSESDSGLSYVYLGREEGMRPLSPPDSGLASQVSIFLKADRAITPARGPGFLPMLSTLSGPASSGLPHEAVDAS